MSSALVFIDTNVWFSFPYGSPNSKRLINAHFDDQIKAVISEQVLKELVINLKNKLPRALPDLNNFLAITPPLILKDSRLLSPRLKLLVHPNDLPILTACVNAKVAYFVTGNTKHFQIDAIKKLTGVTILTPAQVVKEFNL